MKISPKYVMWISIYTSIYALVSLALGAFLEYITVKFDDLLVEDGVQKSKLRLIIEICLQLSANAVGMYLLRTLIEKFVMKRFNIQNAPEQFATLVISTVIFGLQPTLMDKIESVFTIN
jgi:hypothetical protein